MSPRRRPGSIVAALGLLGAIAAQPVRADEASSAPPGLTVRTDAGGAAGRAGAAGAGGSGAALAGPLRLTRPLAPETLARVLAEAESLYRAQQFEQAGQAYATLLELEPRNAHAWLRLGNLHQRAGRDADAIDAYRSASLTVPATRADAEARGKALLNIALLHVETASRAIDELDAMALAGLADLRGEVARQVGAQRHRAHRVAARDFEVAQADGAAPPGAEPSATAPHAVDRSGGRPRRIAARRDAPGRNALAEPLVEAPPAAAPAVEVLRGGRPPVRP